MTASNHAITGAVIAVSVANPVAIPLALLSHFVLDAIPHFGVPINKRGNLFYLVLAIDALVLIGILATLIIFDTPNLVLVLSCVIIAVLPDLAWGFRIYREKRHGADPNVFHDPITKMHSKIQWFEKPIGLYVELVWFLLMVLILYGLL